MENYKVTHEHMDTVMEILQEFVHSIKYYDNLGPWKATKVDLVHLEDDIDAWIKWVRDGKADKPMFNYVDEG